MGSHKLVEIVFYVSLIVVIFLAITFTILFVLYSIYKKKNIRNGHEDQKILEGLKKDYELDKDAISSTEDGRNPYIKLSSCLDRTNRKKRRSGVFGKVISTIVIFFVLVFDGFIIFYANRTNKTPFFFGNTSFLVVQTGSMEKAYDGNAYLKNNNLTNQIEQFSLIGIEKVDAKDVKLYDILAFKNSEGDIIVHRVVTIKNTDGDYIFTLRGDANSASNTWETSVSSKDILGKYNGFNNYGLGIALTYFKSNTGIIAVISAAVFLIAYEASEDLIDREYGVRKVLVANNYDPVKE